MPAVIVSPLVKKGHISNKTYDHSSVIKTILNLTNDSKTDSSSLTERDNNAHDLTSLLTQTIATGHSGNNGPKTLPNPATTSPAPAPEEASQEEIRSRPIPTSGNLQGFLQIALKFEAEILNGTPEEKEALVKKFKQMKTMGEAQDYLAHVDTLNKNAREKRVKEWLENGLEHKEVKEE